MSTDQSKAPLNKLMLALALNNYTVEACARKADRDAACGMTAHPDIMYVPTAEVSTEEAEMIGCGYSIDHPNFEKVLDPIFSRLVERLIGRMAAGGRNAKGPIATEALPIARTRYTIEAIANATASGSRLMVWPCSRNEIARPSTPRARFSKNGPSPPPPDAA